MAAPANARDFVTELCKVRQVRQYQPDAIPDDLLAQVLEVARWTGSSRNTQPWQFIVITDRTLLRQISQLRTPINWVAAAPLAIAIVLDGESALSEAYDEGRVTERILIAAHLLGLGGGVAWFGDDTLQQRAKEILQIPAEHIARGVVALGYSTTARDPRPNPAAGGRKPLTELLSRDHFGKRAE